MREINFRGKCKATNNIVIGDLVRSVIGGNLRYNIKPLDSERINVFKDTIQQYTGFEDANGIGIFEGDRLWSDTYNCVGDIVFEDGCFWFVCNGRHTLLKDIIEDDKETEVISKINN